MCDIVLLYLLHLEIIFVIGRCLNNSSGSNQYSVYSTTPTEREFTVPCPSKKDQLVYQDSTNELESVIMTGVEIHSEQSKQRKATPWYDRLLVIMSSYTLVTQAKIMQVCVSLS